MITVWSKQNLMREVEELRVRLNRIGKNTVDPDDQREIVLVQQLLARRETLLDDFSIPRNL